MDVIHVAFYSLKSIRSTMAWGLEARVPFLDKAFLEVSMNVNPTEKMFSKGASQEVDEDGLPKMEKVQNNQSEIVLPVTLIMSQLFSIS